MKDLLGETAVIAQQELKQKQDNIDELHSGLRQSSTRLTETRRKLETVREKLKQQQLHRQKVANLSRELESIQYRMGSVEQQHASSQNSSAAAWEEELDTAVSSAAAAADASTPDAQSDKAVAALPEANILRARLKATTDVLTAMQNKVSGLRGSSRDTEDKYRRLVALAASCPEDQVDELLGGLVRAVQSEKGELEIGRVRKFLGGVDGV